MLWNGLLDALRFYGGVLVWVGPAWSFTVLLLLLCTTAFLSIALNAAWQAWQARLSSLHSEKPSLFANTQARGWQHAGFLAAGLTSLGLVMLQTLAETERFFQFVSGRGLWSFQQWCRRI